MDNTDFQKSMAYRSIYLEKMAADLKARANPPEKLDVGDAVRIENHISGYWDKTGIVEGVRDHGKSYLISNDDGGRMMLRNRRHIKRMEASEMDLVAEGDGNESGVLERVAAMNKAAIGDKELSKSMGNLERVAAMNKADVGNLNGTQDAPWRNTRSCGILAN